MPPNPERQARMRAKREEMANDPDLAEAMKNASAAVLAGPAGGSTEEVPENLVSGTTEDPEETSADKEAKNKGSGGGSFGVARPAPPPLSQPPIGKPTVAGEPVVRPSPRMMMPRGGGSMQRPMQAAPSDAAIPGPLTITPNLRANTDPLGLGPGFKYSQGGKITKHGSSTSVSCKSKHGG